MKFPETIVDVRGRAVYLRDSTSNEILGGGELTEAQWKSVQQLIRKGMADTSPRHGFRGPTPQRLALAGLMFTYGLFVDLVITPEEVENFPSRFPGLAGADPFHRQGVWVYWTAACKLFDVDYDEAARHR
jgi:hypothetical protein